ncbi:MAG: hypothetical protein AB1698_03560 [Pseudomonadota bacterium]
MSSEHPPKGTGKAAIFIVGVIGMMVVAIFVGFNLNHADTLRDEQAGRVESRDAPQGANDLQHAPPPR